MLAARVVAARALNSGRGLREPTRAGPRARRILHAEAGSLHRATTRSNSLWPRRGNAGTGNDARRVSRTGERRRPRSSRARRCMPHPSSPHRCTRAPRSAARCSRRGTDRATSPRCLRRCFHMVAQKECNRVRNRDGAARVARSGWLAWPVRGHPGSHRAYNVPTTLSRQPTRHVRSQRSSRVAGDA